MPPTDVNQELKLLWKWGSGWGGGEGWMWTKNWLFLGVGGGGGGLDVNKQLKGSYCKNAIKKSWWGVLVLTGAQGGCEWRFEDIVKMKKKVRVGVRSWGSGWMWTKNWSSCKNAKKKVRGEGGSGRGTGCQLVAGLGVGGRGWCAVWGMWTKNWRYC